MKNATLKKRVMAGVISTAMVAGTAVAVAPAASAAPTITANSILTVNAYERLSEADLARYNREKTMYPADNNINLLGTEWGNGWCIDWGLDNPWNNSGGYEVRKLTGLAGRVGTGYEIDENIRIAAINVTKILQKTYADYRVGKASSAEVDYYYRVLRALLSNNLTALNETRAPFLIGPNNGPQYTDERFRNITGFDIRYGRAGNGQPNYVLVPNQAKLNQIAQTVKPGEYVTILVPRNYDWSMTFRRNVTFQRIVTVAQPGLPNPQKPDLNVTPVPPTPGEKITETVTSTRPAVPTTITQTRPNTVTQTTVTETPRTVTSTITYPAQTVTERTTLPTAYTTTKTVIPGTTVTKTVPANPITSRTVVTRNQTPVTETVTVTPPAAKTTVKVPDTPTTFVETVTDTPVVKTNPASTVTTTITETPVRTTEVTVPAATETITTKVTPAPVTTTKVVEYTENYFTEKYYESVREVSEYYYFAGFTREENSKVIELPDSISSSWTFKIVKGQEFVTVERTDEGKLVITPKPGFSGEGEVEILITDDQGNEHIFRVKVSDTVNVETLTKVNVNNFFYTINPGSAERVKVIQKNKNQDATFKFFDKDGKEIKVGPAQLEVIKDETKVTVNVKDPALRGNVVVTITENNQTVSENVVTIEDTTSVFDAVREILNTSTALIESRGGSYKIISGKELLKDQTIVEKDGNWVVKPAPGAKGDVVIVFTDDKGVQYNYTLKIVEDKNAAPDVRESDVFVGDKVNITRQQGWTAEIVSGKASIDKSNPAEWVVTPDDPAGGDVVVHVKDDQGVLVGIWTIHSTPAPDRQEVKLEERERDVFDRSTVSIYLGFNGSTDGSGTPVPARSNWLELEDQNSIVDRDRSTLPGKDSPGTWELHFKPGATGEVVVTEYQREYRDENGNPIETPRDVAVTKYTYKVTPAPVRELKYSITTDHTIDLSGSDLVVKEGQDQLADPDKLPTKPGQGQKTLRLEPKRDAQGNVVVENYTADGYLFERYTINILSRAEETTPAKRQIDWAQTAYISIFDEDEFEVEGAKDAVNVTREGNNLVVTGNPGKTGVVTIKVRDNRGVYAVYELNVVAPKDNQRVYKHKVSTNAAFIASLVNKDNRYEIIQGADFFQAPQTVPAENGQPAQWVLKPKADSVGQLGVVVEYDKLGREVNRYILEITESNAARHNQQNAAVPVDQLIDFPPMKDGGVFTVTDGAEYVITEKVNGAFRVIPKDGTVGKRVVIEERAPENAAAKNVLKRTINLEILEAGVPFNTPKQRTEGGNNDLPEINIDNRTSNGDVNITFPEGVTDLIVTEGKVETSRTESGVDIKNVSGKPQTVKYVLLNENGEQSKVERSIDLTVEIDQSVDTNVSGTGGAKATQKRELSGECIAGIVGLTAPLLLAIPVAILSQVQIPGLEGLQGQINAAIKEANDQIQRGLGIYDQERAERAAGIQGAFQVANPQMIGLAAGSLGLITAGLLIIDQVMHACGASEYTSSYAVGKGSGNERLMYGSSGQGKKYAEEKAAKPSTSEAKPAEASATAAK